MSRVYEIEVKDTALYSEGEGNGDRYYVLHQEAQSGRVELYEVTISLEGPDLRYVSAATYWIPSQTAAGVERGRVAGHGWSESEYGQGLLGTGVPQTVGRTWRNPYCSLKLWTSKVVTVPVEIGLKNGQVVRTLHRLTFNEDFRNRELRPQDVMHHNNGIVSYGVCGAGASMVNTKQGYAEADGSERGLARTLKASGVS